jgi:hypothetical protein
MKRIALIAAATSLVAFSATAAAQDDAGGERPAALGVGVQGFLIGALGTGPSVTFQTPMFHIEGILTFIDDGDADVGLGGRFWYALSQTARSDFSIGGGLALLIDGNADGMGDDDTDVELDLGAQLRAFIVPNVALSATLGFGILIQDGDDFIGLVGDLVGDLGISYFF